MSFYHQNSPQRPVSNTAENAPVLLSTPTNGPFISGVPENWAPFLVPSDSYKPFPELRSVDLQAKWMLLPKLDRNTVRHGPAEPQGKTTLSSAELQSLCDVSFVPTPTPVPKPRADIEFHFDWDPYQAGSAGVWTPREIQKEQDNIPTRPIVNPKAPFRDVFAIGRRRCSWDYVSSESSDESSEEGPIYPIPPRVVSSPVMCELFRPPSVPSLEEEPDIPDFWKEQPPTPPPYRKFSIVPTLPACEPGRSASLHDELMCSASGDEASIQPPSLAAPRSQSPLVSTLPADDPIGSDSLPDSRECSAFGEVASHQHQPPSMASIYLNEFPVVPTFPVDELVRSASPSDSRARLNAGEAASPQSGTSAPVMSAEGNDMNLEFECQPESGTELMPPKAPTSARKRPARPAPANRSKRVIKYSKADLVCRVHGCPNVSKTVHECIKHRDTHFAPRFRCPGCLQQYGRSSALKRHLEKTKGCARSAGPVSTWGVNMVNFATHESEWLAPGVLHEYDDQSPLQQYYDA